MSGLVTLDWLPRAARLPGPWGFFTSGYLVGLVLMAVLIHRIQNIVVPPRHRPRTQQPRVSLLHAASRALFPLDLASSCVRLVLRLPSLYFLSRSLSLWAITLAQTASALPTSLPLLASWAARFDTPSLCWSTFCSVCGALCVEALTRGLEGSSSNASPFNLFGYAFLLHIYSSPMTHDTNLQGLPSRPDKHVVFTIMLPIIQLSVVHTLAIKQSWSDHRLIPSAFVSIVALLHFHWVLWFSNSAYPLLNYIPCLFESALLFVTLLAILLNAFTQIVSEGSVSRPLFGHQATLLPRLDEDFSIALLRMGTASLETSSVSGLGNEVTGVALMHTPLDQELGTVSLSRFGVASVSHAFEGYGKNRRAKKGFANEIRNVKAASNDGDLWLDLAWHREFIRFIVEVVYFLKRMYILSWRFLRSPRTVSVDDATPRDTCSQAEEHDSQDVYSKFVRGEQVTDDEYDEYEPVARSRSNSVESFSSLSDENDHQAEAVSLYADLSSAVGTSSSTSHLLAHLADDSSSPLTRRRFSQLVSRSSSGLNRRASDDGWSDVVQARRPDIAPSRAEDVLDEARKNCVICTVEPRQIICWPCRCLALCDDCRENLASRSSVSKHACPCCRTNVEGYSKIYIP